MTSLKAKPLTDDAFAPYGTVIRRPDRPQDAKGTGWTWWAENVLLPSDGRAFGIGYLDIEPAPLRFDWAERHVRTVEGVIPVLGAIYLYVGRAHDVDDPNAVPDPTTFEVFRVEPGTGVVLSPGTWHGAPLADEPGRTMILLLEGTGRDDAPVVRFEDRPVDVEA